VNKLISILKFFRLVDKDGVLSLTNILVYVLVAGIFFGWLNVYFGISVVVLYGVGRWLNFKRGQIVDLAMRTVIENQTSLQTQLNEQKNKITSLSMKAGLQEGSAANLVGTRRF